MFAGDDHIASRSQTAQIKTGRAAERLQAQRHPARFRVRRRRIEIEQGFVNVKNDGANLHVVRLQSKG